MRMTRPTLIALAALAVFATPAPAKNAKAQKADSEGAPSSCHSYQLRPDGTWAQLPCQELGTNPSMQHRASPKDHDEQAH